jgi:DnaJ-class molecular chaperone
LSDDEQRKLYDEFGHAGVDPNFAGGNPFGGSDPFGQGGPFGGAGGFNFQDGSFHFSSSGNMGGQQIDPEELFDAFFGGGARRRRGPRRGEDLQMHVRLSFEEAVKGSSKDLHLRYQVLNQKTGQIENKEREVTVDTPPGIDHGMNLRLSGQGAEGDPGAPRGNLFVQVLVDDDEYFHRDGADVHTEAPISITQAILGGTVDVKTLNGEVEVKIPKGCQPDAKLMLRGKGIQKLNAASKGNHIVHVKLEIPKKITKRQEELLREFDEETNNSGNGISGRIAKAAESAFGSFFRSKDKKDKDDDEMEETKRAAS